MIHILPSDSVRSTCSDWLTCQTHSGFIHYHGSRWRRRRSSREETLLLRSRTWIRGVSGKMFFLFYVCLLMFCNAWAGGLDLTGSNRTRVSCSQGLSRCTVTDKKNILAPENERVQIRKLRPNLELHCQQSSPCWLCLQIEAEIYVVLDTLQDDKGSREYHKGSVTLCHSTPAALQACKKIHFTINQEGLQRNLGKMSLVLNNPVGVSFGSTVLIYSLNPSTVPPQRISAPSLREECERKPQKNIAECRAPKILTRVNHDENEVELRLVDETLSPTSVCVQFEPTGKCQPWLNTTIPLSSVAPCWCIQSWSDKGLLRSISCPFRKAAFLYENMLQNVTVSVSPANTITGGTILLWNVSAPCKLAGQVWPCQRTGGPCKEVQDLRQQLDNRTWAQNKYGRWVNEGAFDDIDLQLPPCVMVTLFASEQQLGPFCFKNTDRWRWSLLPVGLILLVFLVGIVVCLFHGTIKGFIRGCHHGGYTDVGIRGHVVVISPPDVDAAVSESVRGLASSLCRRGFSVCVDQWCRRDQCRLGPLPWLHSRLLDVDVRVLLVWNRGALDRTLEWTHGQNISGSPKGSPHSDVFTASLSLILADKQLGREHFLLVHLDPGPDSKLPELLEGIPQFHLPSQMQALVSRLSGTKSERRTFKLFKN